MKWLYQPATIIFLGSAGICAIWLLGIYVGAAWERQSIDHAKAGLLCVCKE